MKNRVIKGVILAMAVVGVMIILGAAGESDFRTLNGEDMPVWVTAVQMAVGMIMCVPSLVYVERRYNK